MNKFSLKAIAVALLLLGAGGGTLLAQSSLKGTGTVGTLNGTPVATITPGFRIMLPTSSAPSTKYVADFSAMNLGTDEEAQMFFDENSCNVMDFHVVPGTGTVEVNLHLYPGYTESWTVAEWNNWLGPRCERIATSHQAHAAAKH